MCITRVVALLSPLSYRYSFLGEMKKGSGQSQFASKQKIQDSATA